MIRFVPGIVSALITSISMSDVRDITLCSKEGACQGTLSDVYYLGWDAVR